MSWRNELKRRAQRGIALLNEKVPNWRERVEVDCLNMNDCGICALGQVFGNYFIGLAVLGFTIEDNDDASYGFSLTVSGTAESYALLTECWIEAMREQVEAVEAELVPAC